MSIDFTSLNVTNTPAAPITITNDTIRVVPNTSLTCTGSVAGAVNFANRLWTWTGGLTEAFSNSSTASSSSVVRFNNIPTGLYTLSLRATESNCTTNRNLIIVVEAPAPPPNNCPTNTMTLNFAPGTANQTAQQANGDIILEVTLDRSVNVSQFDPRVFLRLELQGTVYYYSGNSNIPGVFSVGPNHLGPQLVRFSPVSSDPFNPSPAHAVPIPAGSYNGQLAHACSSFTGSPSLANLNWRASSSMFNILLPGGGGGNTGPNCSILANTLSAPTQPVNAGDNFTVENTSHNAPSGATYSWNFSGANVVSGSGKGPYTLNFSSPGTYTISVSYSAGNCSTATTSRTITVNQACDVVTGYTAGTTTSNTAVITWTNSGSNLGYFINYRVVGSNAWQGVQTATNANSRILSGLQPSTNYEFLVRRICAAGVLSRIVGETPGTFSTNTDPNPCAAPTNFQQSSTVGTSATVTWSPVPGASSYVVHARRSGTNAYTLIVSKGANATSHTFTGLMIGNSYDYMIYAGCSGVQSARVTTTGIVGDTKTGIENQQLTIYPNPAAGGVVNLRAEGLTSPELSVQVLDLTGRVLYNNTFRNDLGNSINEQLNMNLSPGTYLLRTSGGLSATQRLVVVE